MLINPNKTLLRFLSNRLGRSATKLELAPRIRTIGTSLRSLTDSEINSISNLWKPIGGNNLNYDYWRFYKTFLGESVNPEIVPDNLYWSRIIRALNPVSLTRTYINKSLYPIIFKGLKQPKVLANVINGVAYDSNLERIDSEKIADLLFDYEDDIIIKPTFATSGGRGVSKIPSSTSVKDLKEILSNYGSNYICQGIVHQSESTAKFNASSLNTFRVNTVNINGKTSCECLMMRHGLNGSAVDNFACGGIVCGMSKSGEFNGNNYNSKLKLVSHLDSGNSYSELLVPEISDVISHAVEAHQRYMPHIGQAAWDFAINEERQPVMIEVNLMLPGIIMEQLTNAGSIFGDRTEEVINYAIERNKHLSWTEFVGGWQ